jgi:hypothetical protein
MLGFPHFETSCAAGAPLRMKKGILEAASSLEKKTNTIPCENVHRVLARGRDQIISCAQRCDGFVGASHPQCLVCRRKRSAAPGHIHAPECACDSGAGDSGPHRRSARASSLRGSRELLALIDAQDRSIMHLEQEIERHLRPFEGQVQRCEQINGVRRSYTYLGERYLRLKNDEGVNERHWRWGIVFR